MKKILAKTACVFLGMSLLFGCGGRKNENSAGALEQDAGKGSDVWTNKGKEENSDGVGAGSGQDKNSGQGMGFGQEDDKQGTDSDTENTAPPAFPMIPMFGTSGRDTSIFDSLEAFAKDDYSNGMLGYHLIDSGKEIVIRGNTKEDSQKMVEVARAVHTPVERNQMIYEIILDEALSFLNGAKSRQAAAGEIANRMRLYYYE